MIINKTFNARQCYIKPNEHFMPMTLDGISDESSYNISDRQFYGQTYNIKVNAYIITESDYRVEETPYKLDAILPLMKLNYKNIPEVEIDEYDDNEGNVKLTIYYPEKSLHNVASFTIDTDIIIDRIELENLYNNYEIFINDVIHDNHNKISMMDGDEIKIKVCKQYKRGEAKMVLYGKINNFSKNM
jgi:hypothetical protein